jgi:hypothetical protein
LNYGKYIEDVIKTGPTHLKISISGIGDHYEITHTGGKWSRLYKNLYAVAKYINKYSSDTNVSISYHANKINLSDYKTIYNLCIKLGFRLDPVVSTIFPCFAMDYIEGKTLPASAIKAKELMLIDLEDIIEQCKTEHNKACMAARGYPNINWDLSVFTCCNLPYDKLADNYLDISFSDMIDLRNRSPLCTKCIKYSLHRFWQTTYFSNMLYPILTEINNVPPTI